MLYVVEDAAEVGVIFEVMNNQGKQLSELDLVKNYVLYLGTKLDLPEHPLHSDVVQAWGGIFRDPMAAGLTETMHEEQLLRAHWFLAYDHQRKNWDGLAIGQGAPEPQGLWRPTSRAIDRSSRLRYLAFPCGPHRVLRHLSSDQTRIVLRLRRPIHLVGSK